VKEERPSEPAALRVFLILFKIKIKQGSNVVLP